MAKERIQVYTDSETKRRVELAAAKQDVAVTKYWLAAIMQLLDEDDMLEREKVEIAVKHTRTEDMIAGLRTLRQKIKTRRGGKLIDVDIVREVREERDHELTSLR